MTTTTNQHHIDAAKKTRQIWGDSAKVAAQHIMNSSYDVADATAILDLLRHDLPEHAVAGLLTYVNGRRTISGQYLDYQI